MFKMFKKRRLLARCQTPLHFGLVENNCWIVRIQERAAEFCWAYFQCITGVKVKIGK